MRRGLALVTALWWLTGTLAVMAMVFQWMQFRGRIERKTAGAADLLDAADQVIAHEIARLKARPWSQRWYATSGGAAINGTLANTDYTGFVQDVASFWRPSAPGPAVPLEGQTDVIFRVTRGTGADRTTGCFLFRLAFRQPSPERPTAFHVRRMVRLPEMDPAAPAARVAAVDRVNASERRRENNRPSSAVLAREVAEWGRREPTFTLREVRDNLSLNTLQPAVDAERRELGHLRATRRFLSEPASAPATSVPGHGRYLYAQQQARLALSSARLRPNPHGAAAIPRALYAVGVAESLLARTHPHAPGCTALAPCTRHAWFASAMAAFDEITIAYPFDPDPMSPNFSPLRHEAPHAFVALAFTALAGARLGDAADETAARDLARSFLRRLRERYPDFRLFGEGARTGAATGSETAPLASDEATWYLEQLANRPVLAIGGESIRRQLASQRIFRWVPGATPDASTWVDEARLHAGRTGHAVAALRATAATAGRAVGERFLITGGRDYAGAGVATHAEIYDPYTREVRALPAAMVQPRDRHGMAQLADGRILIAGGDDATRAPGFAVLECEAFDPVDETFTAVPWTLGTARSGARTARMTSGTLVNFGDDSAEWMPAAGGPWTPICNRLPRARRFAQAAPLSDAGLLIAGGAATGQSPVSTAAILFTTGTPHFDPALSGSCTVPTDSVTLSGFTTRWHGFAVRLEGTNAGGRVLIGGGLGGLLQETRGAATGISYVTRLEVWDPATNAVTDLGDANGVGGSRRAAALPDGSVLIVNGRRAGQARDADGLCELYIWNPDPGLRQRHNAAGFPDGIDLTELGHFE